MLGAFRRPSMSALPAGFDALTLPAIVSPMFLVSGPDLVVESCKAGVIGTFPALNQRTTEGYVEWLQDIQSRLDEHDATAEMPAAPYGVNLIVHRSNPRLEADLEATVAHKVPLVITSLGAVSSLVDAVHSYGGVVFHDVANIKHARKAAEAGVDGIIAVGAGAGGHAGTVSPFALVSEIREFFDKTIILAGCLSHGQDIAAARAMGADFAYLGTRFIATAESAAQDTYKKMLTETSAEDVMYTAAISGVPANFLRPSLVQAGLDPDNLKAKTEINFGEELDVAKAWKDVWSAGQGVGGIHDVPTTAELVARLDAEYRAAVADLAALPPPLTKSRL